MKIDNFRNLADVDLLVHVDLKNNWLVEFSDQKYKPSSKFKSRKRKLRILERPPVFDLWPMLTFWPMWTDKIISDWIQWPEIYILFKFKVNGMKIEDFRNSNLVVDLWPMLTFWSMLTSKIIGKSNSVSWNVNPLQISSQSDENWQF